MARELGQTQIKKSLSLIPDENRLHTLQILDMDGRMLLALTRPAKLIKSKMRVAAADGTPIGQVVQKTTGFIHDVRFTLEADGKVLGTLETDSAESIRFSIRDAAGTEIGRISKTWAGLRKEWFTNADNYVVQIHRPLDEPLRPLLWRPRSQSTWHSGKVTRLTRRRDATDMTPSGYRATRCSPSACGLRGP